MWAIIQQNYTIVHRNEEYIFIFILYLFYLTANDGRPGPGVPSAGTSCDNKSINRGEKRCIDKPVINKDAKKEKHL